MFHRPIAILLAAAGLVTAPASAAAQRVPPRLHLATPQTSRPGIGRPGPALSSPGDLPRDHLPIALGAGPPPRRRAHAAPYIAVGAVVGAAATAGGLLYYFRTSSGRECICGPVILAPAVVGGAAVGAVAGAVVYAVRRR
jgi:hypothetical protein